MFFSRRLFSFFIVLFSANALLAQTDKRSIDQKFFEFDLYPFELVETGGKWGLQFKQVYERALAVNYLKRNFHYNTRVDTLVKNTWLALPFYDKFERWSYGPRFQFIVGTRGNKVDVFTLSGEILGSNVTEFLPEKVNLEKSDVVMTLKTGSQWKWYYEGDFYNKNTTIYYNSPVFDKLEIIRDTVVQNFQFATEVQGVKQRYNLVGHELSGNVLAVETKQPVKEEEKPQVLAVVEKKQEAKPETVVKAVEPLAVKETPALATAQAEIAALKKQLEAEQKARAAAEQKAAEQTKRAEQAEQAKAAAELKAKNEEQEKLAAQNALREALDKAKAANEQLTSAEAEQKAKKETEIKAAVEKALKEAEQQAKSAMDAAAAEAQKAKQEAELAKANAEKERKEKAAAELKAKQEAEANAAAEQQAKEEAEAKKVEAVKLAVEKALKEAELKAQQQSAAEKKAKEDELARTKAEAEKKAKQEAELKAKEAAELKAKQEAELKAKEQELAKANAEAEKKSREEAEVKKAEEIKRAVENALKEAQEKERIIAQQKANEEAVAAEKQNQVTLKKAVAENFGEIIQDRNIVMQKILVRDKMLTYEFYKENNLYGLKNAEGKVLIHPVMKNINIIYPSNPELKYGNINAAIEFELDGTIFRITNPDFAGPENLGSHAIKCTTCSSGFKSVEVKWDAAKGRYSY
ncbi:MAG: hypothetical protein AB7P01_14720 [Bacteroidia bacterium]